MSLNEKIMKTAMNSAMSSFNEQIPMFQSAINLYGEPKTKEAYPFFGIEIVSFLCQDKIIR